MSPATLAKLRSDADGPPTEVRQVEVNTLQTKARRAWTLEYFVGLGRSHAQ